MRESKMLLSIVAWSAAGLSQTPSALPKPGPDTPIVVEGQSAPALRRYVDKVAKPELGHQIARWNAPICIKVDGISEKFASFLTARVSEVARSLDLTVLAPGCPINVTVTMSDRADALAKALVQARPKRVGNINSDAPLPPATVTALEAPRTIRWMTASETVSADGVPLGRTDTAENATLGPTTNKVYDSSLIRSYVREDAVAKIIIIDQSRLAGVTLAQLADYVAFLAVSTPDISADYRGVNSIMALFAGGDPSAAPAGLTSADRAFLHALYSTRADRTADQQRGSIRQQVSHKPT